MLCVLYMYFTCTCLDRKLILIYECVVSVCFVIQFVGLYGIIFYDDTCNNDVDIVTDDTVKLITGRFLGRPILKIFFLR